MIRKLNMTSALAILIITYLITNLSFAAQPQGKAKEDSSYNSAIKSAFPMTEKQIKQVRKLQEQSDLALHGALEKIIHKQRTVLLSVTNPKSHVVHITPNFASIISFYDLGGRPWKIDHIIGSDGLGIKSQIIGNQAIILTNNDYLVGTIAVTLDKLNNVISLDVQSNSKISDRRVSFNVQQINPGQKSKLVSPIKDQVSENTMLDLLSGTIPVNAQPLKVNGNINASAWLIKSFKYIVTGATLISPAWISSISSEGQTVYKVPAGYSQFIFNSHDVPQTVSVVRKAKGVGDE